MGKSRVVESIDRVGVGGGVAQCTGAGRSGEEHHRGRVEHTSLNQHDSGADQGNGVERNGGEEQDCRSSPCWRGLVDLSVSAWAFCKHMRAVPMWDDKT